MLNVFSFRKRPGTPFCAAIILWLVAGAGFLLQFFHERQSIGEITFLFLPPLIVQCVGLFRLWPKDDKLTYYSFNLRATFVALFFCYVSWIGYSYFLIVNHQLLQQICSIIILLVILVILAFVATMTFALTRPTNHVWKKQYCDELNSGVTSHPFWAIIFFITLFLGTSYLFGFSLAFHDLYARTKKNKTGQEMAALRMVNFDTIDEDQQNTNSIPEPQAGAKQPEISVSKNPSTHMAASAAASSPSIRDGVTEEFCFYFQDIRAYMDKAKTVGDCGALNPPSRTQSNLKKPADFNFCSLKAIADTLKPRIERGDKVRIVLIGHASNERSYKSNFELSEARAHNVKHTILELIPNVEKRRNVEWDVYPAGDEPLRQVNRGVLTKDLFHENELTTRLSKSVSDISISDIEGEFSQEEIDQKIRPEEKRVVIVTIEPIPEDGVSLKPGQLEGINQKQIDTSNQVGQVVREQQEHIRQSQARPLKLMDYMYFSIYTITTTGYGDIIPTTAYAKFVISLANLCEVLFLVVFFNALISLKDRPPGESND